MKSEPGPAMQSAKYRVLKSVFGFDHFRPGQEAVVDDLLSGRHTLAVMPTGAGKSLCFQIPALVHEGLAVVVSPLVSLMENQVAALDLAGVPAAAINSSRPREDNVAIWYRVRAGEIRLLYMSPERLMTEPMIRALGKLPLSMIIVDESHCISQWGHSFRPEYRALQSLKEHFPEVTIGAFTATADAVTREDIVDRLFGGRASVHVSGFDRPNISLSVSPKDRVRRQISSFVAERQGQCGIVYCLSRQGTEDIAELLRGDGHDAMTYHAGLDSDERAQRLDMFMTRPGVVMVATIAFGMGIDKPDVRFVVHADLPATVEAYYQEIGRAGRDGRAADAQLFFGLNDIRQRRRFIDESDAEAAVKRIEYRRLDALTAYCEAVECRRVALMAYFGEVTGACGNCDVCISPPEVIDGTDLGRLVLTVVENTGERFGAAHIADCLTGQKSDKVTSNRHDRLPVFGEGRDRKVQEWRAIIRQLVASGFLEMDIGGHGSLLVTDRGRALQAGQERVRLNADSLDRAGGRRKSASTSRAGRGASDDSDVPRDLLERLKETRLRLAREEGVPAYVVFHDSTLADMARERPRTRDAFARIHGVGARKVDRFSAPFLDTIAEYLDGR